jgi:hypothetical protein
MGYNNTPQPPNNAPSTLQYPIPLPKSPPLALNHNPTPPPSSRVGCDNRFAEKTLYRPHPLHYPPPYANDLTTREQEQEHWIYATEPCTRSIVP